jgi:hypothetical protein
MMASSARGCCCSKLLRVLLAASYVWRSLLKLMSTAARLHCIQYQFKHGAIVYVGDGVLGCNAGLFA